MKGWIAGPLDRCIYGDHDDPEGFTHEHIIPQSLGETSYIANASCHQCSAITSYIEGYCARNLFQEFRAHQGIRGKRRGKNKRRNLEFPITIKSEDKAEVHMVPASDHPSFLIMPALSMPGILAGKPPSSTWERADFHVWQARSHQRAREFVQAKGGGSYEITKTVTPKNFVRLLAKIGHCFAVAVGGYGSFEPYLPGIILGTDENHAYLVGGHFQTGPPGRFKQELQLEEGIVGGKTLLAARIRLFANVGTPEHGTPVYYAVVGEKLP